MTPEEYLVHLCLLYMFGFRHSLFFTFSLLVIFFDRIPLYMILKMYSYVIIVLCITNTKSEVKKQPFRMSNIVISKQAQFHAADGQSSASHSRGSCSSTDHSIWLT